MNAIVCVSPRSSVVLGKLQTFTLSLRTEAEMGSVIKKRRKRMSKKKHRKLLRKTRHQRK